MKKFLLALLFLILVIIFVFLIVMSFQGIDYSISNFKSEFNRFLIVMSF